MSKLDVAGGARPIWGRQRADCKNGAEDRELRLSPGRERSVRAPGTSRATSTFFVTNFFVTRAHRNRSASPAESSFVTREPSWRRRRRTSRSRRLCVIGPSGRKRPRHQTGPPSSVEGAAKTRACRARAPAPNRFLAIAAIRWHPCGSRCPPAACHAVARGRAQERCERPRRPSANPARWNRQNSPQTLVLIGAAAIPRPTPPGQACVRPIKGIKISLYP
jgi:hypothetical protein